MKKVYSLTEHYLNQYELVYASEKYGTCSIFQSIEENDDGSLDDQYEIDIIHFVGNGEMVRTPTVLTRIGSYLFEVKYEEYSIKFKATKKPIGVYAGDLNGPKGKLHFLIEKDAALEEEICHKHNVIISGYFEIAKDIDNEQTER